MVFAAVLLVTSNLPGVAAAPLRAQAATPPGVIDGVVTDTGLVPLAGATVSILGSAVRVATRENGRFRILRLPVGRYIVVAHHLGYVPVSAVMQVVDGDTLRTSFALERIMVALDTVVVVAKRYSMRMGEFEARRAFGVGHFLTRSDIEARNVVFVADLVRPILSVRIEEGDMSQVAYSFRGTGKCPLQVYLDGMPLPSPTNLRDLPSPREIAGIEVYSGAATIPLQYKRANSGCGVILIWTKDGS